MDLLSWILIIGTILLLGISLLLVFQRRRFRDFLQDFLKNDRVIYSIVGVLVILVFVLWFLAQTREFLYKFMS